MILLLGVIIALHKICSLQVLRERLEGFVSDWIRWVIIVDVECVLVQGRGLKKGRIREFSPIKCESDRSNIEASCYSHNSSNFKAYSFSAS